jgi:hypothetical protein
VDAISTVRLTFGHPHYGWLPVRIDVNDLVVDCDASGVLQNPVLELVEMLAFALGLRSERDTARVFLWLEPETYIVEAIWWTADDLRVRVWHADAMTPPAAIRDGHDLYLEGVISAAQLAASLRAGLATYFTTPATDHWPSFSTERAAFEALVSRP